MLNRVVSGGNLPEDQDISVRVVRKVDHRGKRGKGDSYDRARSSKLRESARTTFRRGRKESYDECFYKEKKASQIRRDIEDCRQFIRKSFLGRIIISTREIKKLLSDRIDSQKLALDVELACLKDSFEEQRFAGDSMRMSELSSLIANLQSQLNQLKNPYELESQKPCPKNAYNLFKRTKREFVKLRGKIAAAKTPKERRRRRSNLPQQEKSLWTKAKKEIFRGVYSQLGIE